MEEVTLSQPISYVVACATTGAVLRLVTAPKRAVPSQPDAGQKIVIVTDGNLPKHSQYVLKLDMLPGPVTYVEQFSDIVQADEWPTRGGKPDDLDVRRNEVIGDLDRAYAERLAAVAGPLAALHAEKRRQAEAGGGPLVVDEADRLAILANAARQDEAITEIERRRRTVKALLRAASTESDIAAALALFDDERKPI